MARDVLEIAAGELGNTENPAGSNRTKYGRWMGLDGQPWCMSFVQWCFAQAGLPLPCKTGSCSALLAWYKQNKPECIVEEPRPGDIIIYNFGHTGLVESAARTTITAIEGNTSPGEAGSQSNGGMVCRKRRQSKYIIGAVRPQFNKEQEDDTMTGKEIYDALSEYLGKQPLPAWAKAELEEAKRMGITDGKEPMQLIPRYQAAIMAKRAVERK